MMETAVTHISGVLKKTGLFNDEQLVGIIGATRTGGTTITETVVKGGLAEESDFLEALAGALNIPFVRLANATIEPPALERLPTKTIFQYNVIPVSLQNNVLQVAVNDPFTAGLLDMLRLAAGTRIRLSLSTSEDISKAAKKFYGIGAETVDRMMKDDRFDISIDESLAKMDLSELDQEASIVKFVNQIIWEACQQGSTDIHFEPMEHQLRIRYRVDGVLHQIPVPQQLNRFQAAIISRIKVMANMDIAEKRLPMDGRIGLRVHSTDIDIRVSTMPTVYGESVSLRLLRRGGSVITLNDLGMTPRDGRVVRKLIERPNGIILVTGPTGSGKSTSLYAFLQEINTIDQRILTVEEPIEYEMAGVNQVLVRPEIGLTFAKALRHFLRQDPDIIMVGEIRDLETAEIAIQAALTGHLVFSTLHTNDAAASFTRLVDMGMEPYLIASAVEGVIAQRLVRVLCPHCKTPAKPDVKFLQELGFPTARLPGSTLCTSAGCDACRSTGFHGRLGIFEVLEVTDELESLVTLRRPSNELKQKAMSQGMMSLRDDGWEKVLAGLTTVEEVIRATEENE